MTTISLLGLGVAAICFAVRLVVGPTLSDRVIGLDGLVIVGVAAVAIRSMVTDNGSFLPVLVVVTLVGFVGTAASARFIESRAEDRTGPSDSTGPQSGDRADGPDSPGVAP